MNRKFLQKLKAQPEKEDFGGKYTKEGSGKIGGKLLNNYFESVRELYEKSNLPTTRLKGLKAIELGCGEGHSTNRLQSILSPQVDFMASDFVEEQIPTAEKLNPGIKFIQESVYETTHAENTFDLVFLLEVLEHLDYPDIALEEIKRITKPAGYLILGVPREPLWRILNASRGKYLKSFGNTPGHLNHWSGSGIESYIAQNYGKIVARRSPLPWTILLAKNTNIG